MTQSASVWAAERPPAIYRRATFVIVVSRISMNVGTTTTQATIQWLIAGRLTAVGLIAMLLMVHPPLTIHHSRSTISFSLAAKRSISSRLGAGGGCGGQRLQDLPRVWPRRRLLVVHVRRDRHANEEWRLGRVVVGQFDPDRQPLDDLDEVAGGVLRRQQGERLARSHGEARDPALELLAAAVHVHLAAHPLPDTQVRQLGFLEVGVDP